MISCKKFTLLMIDRLKAVREMTMPYRSYWYIFTFFCLVCLSLPGILYSASSGSTEEPALEKLFKSCNYDAVIQLTGKKHLKGKDEKLFLAKSLELTGDFQRSSRIYRELYRKNPEENYHIGLLIARSHEKSGDLKKAVKWYRTLLSGSRREKNWDFNRTAVMNTIFYRLSLSGTHCESALKLLKRYQKLYPAARCFLGSLYQERGEPVKASDQYLDILIDDNDIYTNFILKEIIQDKRVINALHNKDLKNTELMNRYFENGLYHEAIMLSYFLAPQNKILQKRALCYYRIGDYETAVQVFSDVYAESGDPVILLRIAYSYFSSGNRDLAYSFYRRYVYEDGTDKRFSAESSFLRLQLERESKPIQLYLDEVVSFVEKHSDFRKTDWFLYNTFYYAVQKGAIHQAVSFLNDTHRFIKSVNYQSWALFILGLYYDTSYMGRAVSTLPGSYYYFKAAEYLETLKSSTPYQKSEEENSFMNADQFYKEGNYNKALQIFIQLYSRNIQREYIKSKIIEILKKAPAQSCEMKQFYDIEKLNSGALYDFYKLGFYEDVEDIIHSAYAVSQQKYHFQFHYLLSKISYERGDIYGGLHHAETMVEEFDRRYLLFLPDEVLKLLYPSVYREMIDAYLTPEFRQLDSLFVLAVIREESRYKADARSSKGAAGLMQLMPDTAQWIMNKPLTENDLLDPSLNIQTGIQYLRFLFSRFNSLEEVLAAYNGGPTNVRKWLRRDPGRSREVFVEEIPYAETRNFVKKVYTAYSIYCALWD